MKSYLLSAITAFVFASLSTAANACPDYNQYGDTYSFTGNDLYSPKSFSVLAGGRYDIQNCGFSGWTGNVEPDPDFSFDLSGMGHYQLKITVTSKCDAMLLVNDSQANWKYDDDTNGLNPELWIEGTNGWLDIWIGTYENIGSNYEMCPATLTVESF